MVIGATPVITLRCQLLRVICVAPLITLRCQLLSPVGHSANDN